MTEKITGTQWFYLENKESMDELLELLDCEEKTGLNDNDEKKVKEIKNKLLNDNEILFDVISKIVTAEKKRFKKVKRGKMLSYTNTNKFSGQLFEHWENDVQLKLHFDLGKIGDGFGNAPALLINFMVWSKDEEVLQKLNENLSKLYQKKEFEESVVYNKERHDKAVDKYFQGEAFDESEEYFGDDNLLYAEFELKENMPYKDIEKFVYQFMEKYINNHWKRIQEILNSEK